MSKITSYQNGKIFYDEQIAWKYIKIVERFLKNKAKAAKAKGFIVGISGGIDSSVVYMLAKRVFPQNAQGVVMPIIKMTQSDLNDITKLEQASNSKFLVKDLTQTFNAISCELDIDNSLALANIKPRLRMTTLYALAQQLNYLVLGTDNADEIFVGYFTKFGDGGADLLPISQFTKGEVKFIASLLNVPPEIIHKNPSAGLWEGQTDELEMGFSYQDLDFYLNHLKSPDVIKQNLDSSVIEKINNLHLKTQHKRDKIYTPKNIK
ncbi:NAD(+) synthase [Mycoplasmopsis cricetuli]|uniref:NAD(+) synthase n=1 Tax=Mycoplasmopsis cricetuli TaxID=171283 RepID=UPI0004727876|nr:NAD(+) synthase [Mycoplasmopsis cricetuli]